MNTVHFIDEAQVNPGVSPKVDKTANNNNAALPENVKSV